MSNTEHALPHTVTQAAPAPRPPRRWPWVLLAIVALLVLATAVSGAHLLRLLFDGQEGWQLVVHGEDLLAHELGFGKALALVGALLLAVLIALIVVPLAVGLALLAASVGVGLAVLVLAALALIALSPLLLPLLLIWLIVRRPRTGAPPAQASTMAA